MVRSDDKALVADLNAMRAKVAEAESKLAELEGEIQSRESEYYKETLTRGNVVKGWETFLKRPDKSWNSVQARKIKAVDRIFSNSSTSRAPEVQPGDGEKVPKKIVIQSGGILKKKKFKKKVSEG
ncbi:hypothetical protein NDN08_005806 [Rhodosorus marinus]|uniref:Chromatin modification-related protein MEAF6 n=1 Tax=Rhodosorus marinus TaxID=101924 RepID=A0AAV8V2N0_9RHOD|nr:hypothetical protein NDN08_005806 [Rhodosorus marinus]